MIRSKSPHALFTITTSNSATFLLLLGRHAQCDLHTTSDVVLRPELNAKCTVPFTPGTSPKCCASDFTLAEIKTLCGKMDSSGSVNGTAEEYAYGGTAAWRTDLYHYSCPVIPTHMVSSGFDRCCIFVA